MSSAMRECRVCTYVQGTRILMSERSAARVAALNRRDMLRWVPESDPSAMKLLSHTCEAFSHVTLPSYVEVTALTLFVSANKRPI
jgi:hypothetical protein